jgi:hypothetical protein
MTSQKAALCILLAGIILLPEAMALAADGTNVEEEVQLLREENALLKQQVQKQGVVLDTLSQKVEDLQALDHVKTVEQGENPPPTQGGLNFGKVNLSAEGGVAFFNTGPDGFAPDSDFRVDESRIFVEAPVWNTVYFYGDIDLATRENTTLNTQLGELYLDFEDVSQLWGKDGQLNVRAGRLEIPFGEEYLTRYAMENPLISRSLSDLWGYDPGVELYGTVGKFSYVAAVQNGGGNGVQDFDSDKSVAGRISYDPNPHWHFSVSGMRTGHIDVQNDMSTALWFGSGWFRSIGSPATSKFDVDLVEGDIACRWKSGHVSAFGGYAHYSDNDPTMDNARDIYYYSIEAQQKLPHKFYAAARFSQIFANHGYPIVGYGNFNEYYLEKLTTQLWRASLGLGYSFSDNLALKVEYSFENGRTLDGESRDNENFFGTEAVFKF